MLSPEKYFEAVKKLENEMITVINSMKEKNTRNKVNSFLHEYIFLLKVRELFQRSYQARTEI